MLTAPTCRAARALLGWSQRELAGRTGLSPSWVKDFEAGLPRNFMPVAIAAAQRALEEAGVEFLNGDSPGVRLRKL